MTRHPDTPGPLDRRKRERRRVTPDGVLESIDLRIAGKGTTETRQIGWGEFEPAGGSRARSFLRYAFLEMIRETERKDRRRRSGVRKIEVLKELSGAPFAEFMKAESSVAQFDAVMAGGERDRDTDSGRLRSALDAWAVNWGLDAPWCLGVALDTMAMWRAHDELIASLPAEVPEELKLLLTLPDRGARKRGRKEGARKPFNPKRDPPIWGHSLLLDPETTTLLRDDTILDTPYEWVPPFFAHIELSRLYLARAKIILLKRLNADPRTSRLGPAERQPIVKAGIMKLKKYCQRVMLVYEAQKDSTGAPQWKRVGRSFELTRDIHWAVEVQVRGRTASDVANEELGRRMFRGEYVGSVPPSKVTRRVEWILQEIELPKRGDYRAGRPKRKNTPPRKDD